jgi:hypothetical protein
MERSGTSPSSRIAGRPPDVDAQRHAVSVGDGNRGKAIQEHNRSISVRNHGNAATGHDRDRAVGVLGNQFCMIMIVPGMAQQRKMLSRR